MPRQRVLTDTGFKIVLVAVEWVALYELNTLFLSAFSHSERANWIFLPAAVRVISILLFGWRGAVGLVLGAFITLPQHDLADIVFELALATTSGAAPWIAVTACRRYLSIPDSLARLQTTHVIAASIATAVVNSALVNGCSALFDRWHGEVGQLAAIVVGDIVGAAIVLGLIALLARIIGRRAG